MVDYYGDLMGYLGSINEIRWGDLMNLMIFMPMWQPRSQLVVQIINTTRELTGDMQYWVHFLVISWGYRRSSTRRFCPQAPDPYGDRMET